MTKTIHPFVVTLLAHKMGGGKERAALIRGGSADLKFRPIGGALIRGGGGGAPDFRYVEISNKN